MGMGKEESKDINMSAKWEFLLKVIHFTIHRVPILENAKIGRGWSACPGGANRNGICYTSE
jgi:hypothetical protein